MTSVSPVAAARIFLSMAGRKAELELVLPGKAENAADADAQSEITRMGIAPFFALQFR